ncbi:hypothetical protein [Streptomyces koyangensis]
MNVAVRVLTTPGEGPHVIHVHHVREDERSAPLAASTTTGSHQSAEPSGPRVHPSKDGPPSTPSTD